VRVFGAKETTHDQLNDHLGVPDDPATKALWEFIAEGVKK
jgi:arylformamidase